MKFLSVIIFFSFWDCFSQTVYEKMPEGVEEIHFVYEQKSNYLINDKGVFADTLLFKIDFPNIKYSLRKHPKDTTFICGFSPLNNFNEFDKKKLTGVLYHNNEIINGIHYVSKKKTILNVVRFDEETKIIFKKYFNDSYVKFEYRQDFDFIKSKERLKYPAVTYDHTFTEISKKVEFKNNKNIGFYSEKLGKITLNNVVFFNNELSKFISPILFDNNEFGVEKLQTIYKTVILKSVYYK